MFHHCSSSIINGFFYMCATWSWLYPSFSGVFIRVSGMVPQKPTEFEGCHTETFQTNATPGLHPHTSRLNNGWRLNQRRGRHTQDTLYSRLNDLASMRCSESTTPKLQMVPHLFSERRAIDKFMISGFQHVYAYLDMWFCEYLCTVHIYDLYKHLTSW